MGKSSAFEESVAGNRQKSSSEAWASDMQAKMGFKWEGGQFFNGPHALPSSTTSASPLALQLPTDMPNGDDGPIPIPGDVATSPMLGCDPGPTDQERHDLSCGVGGPQQSSSKVLTDHLQC